LTVTYGEVHCHGLDPLHSSSTLGCFFCSSSVRM
jgi:hypothetical protein